MNPSEPPFWPYCAHGADPAVDPVGCRGIHVPGHTACLAHLTGSDRDAYLGTLIPGADVNHSGTPFTHGLLHDLLKAVRDPTTGRPHLGFADFSEAQFEDAGFSRVLFSGPAWFSWAQFSGSTWFDSVQFSSDAVFGRARFQDANFAGTWFASGAAFTRAQFSDHAMFGLAQFSADTDFEEVSFSRLANFGSTHFSGNVRFKGVRFEGAPEIGPLWCTGTVVLSMAAFTLPVTLQLAAREVVAVRTRWESTATIRLRYATLDLSHAVLSAPMAVIHATTPFTDSYGASWLADAEQALSGSDSVRVISVQGVDAAHLVLTDTDLTDCLFSGAFHLDQLRLEGRTAFAIPPTGWLRRGLWPVRWTRRRALAEEHHWRAQSSDQPVPDPGGPSQRQWRPGPHHPDPARTPDPEDVAALYRQLRKALEDGKNEPGAADFYYGECEMRRHDSTGTPPGERRLLWGYWLLSGYGLRASRAFGWLITAMFLTVLLLMRFGMPTHEPDPATTGTLEGQRISLHTSTPAPALRGGWREHFTAARAEKATRVAINSVVFRSSGQNLTTVGTYIEMASRLLEPTLLALGVLAIRGRIKR
ncbi:pentapeptide repeat-containing protein [Streptomyces sp. NPDC005395]|uniref:pentapeptide repeat-containing protein n=1 Tax=Streptomyces sp. NPDC005395 TaxID=3157042 RepID=UPI0033BCC9A9